MLLAEQDVVVSYESIWRWCLKFGWRFTLQFGRGVLERTTLGTWMRFISGPTACFTTSGEQWTSTAASKPRPGRAR